MCVSRIRVPRAGGLLTTLALNNIKKHTKSAFQEAFQPAVARDVVTGLTFLLDADAIVAGIGIAPLGDGALVASAQLGESVGVAVEAAGFATGSPSWAVGPFVASEQDADLPWWALMHMSLI